MYVQMPYMSELYFEWDEVKRKTNIKKHDVDLIRIISARKGDSKESRQYRGEL